MSGAIMGAEALARWNSKKYGWVSPAEFIPLLEQSGLIDSAGKVDIQDGHLQVCGVGEV